MEKLPTQLARWVADALSNWEHTSDDELRSTFIEAGIPRDLVEKAIKDRPIYMNFNVQGEEWNPDAALLIYAPEKKKFIPADQHPMCLNFMNRC